jgi:DNA polymerase-3 subunit gamma/tau
VSLYRNWRPKTFGDLVGQDAVVRTLTSAIEAGRLAHAYLFSGPRGSGKTSAAKILARCINCVNGPTAVPDNTCENCLAILAGTALDVLEIDAASNRGIDEIRALREAVKFAPATMRMKIYIVDEAHMLTKEGANAFLKTLEEPPPHAVFILATTEPERLPPTVLSRCQRYAFRRIAVPVMIEKMREVAAGEGIAVDDEALAAIAYRADGGLRDALTMLEQLGAFAGGQTATVETLDVAFGSSGREFARGIVDAALAGDAAGALQQVEAATDAGSDLLVLIRALIAGFRHLLVAQVDLALLQRDLSSEDVERVAAQARDVAQSTLLEALRILTEAQTLARSGGNPRIELESALLRFVLGGDRAAAEPSKPAAPSLPAPAPTPAASSRTEPAAVRRPAPARTAAAENADAPSVPLNLNKVRAAWQNIRANVESERQSLRAPLSRAAIESLESNAIVLSLPNAWSADTLRQHAALVERAIADVLGTPLKITVRVDASAGRAQTETEDADVLFDYANQRIR